MSKAVKSSPALKAASAHVKDSTGEFHSPIFFSSCFYWLNIKKATQYLLCRLDGE
jgi:hypothetical protein